MAKRIKKQPIYIRALALVCFALLGTIITLHIHAAPPEPDGSIEPESGILSGSAAVIADPAASGGNAVRFTGVTFPQPTWSDEFDGTSLSYATDSGGGTWRTKGYEGGGSLSTGYTDYAGSSWNATQAQIQQYGLIDVSNSIVTLKAMRNPGIPGVSANWIGTYLVTNNVTNLTWRYGYFEWRMALPNPVRGMFPALWMFNNVAGRSDGYEGAELDMLEVFGNNNGQPWAAGVHYNPLALSGSHGNNVATTTDDTSGWHRYAINWTPTAITYYKDGAVVGSVTGAGATWYQNANLGIRMDYVMDPSWLSGTAMYSTPTDPAPGTIPTMQVDYVRYYDTMPAGLPLSSADPTK